ncbi:MAG: T9SS type A sorting domain-containing protein [Candidatus Kapabacteria bacterium]|nr:T9SS type A sorting domain-containing protein [Candidatus Kapabacteria bacterium]
MILLLLMLCLAPLHAQTYTPGETYFGKDGLIEYQAGNIPLIISVPHGGRLEPTSIPDRDCDGCVYVMDSYTQELAREIRNAFAEKSGCYPHVIYNLLHRKKLDMNRALAEATDSNEASTAYWMDYQGFIDSAKSTVLQQHGKGLFIDLHGHGHTKQRIEYGYLLYGSQLRESDSVLNTAKRIAVSSIRYLVGTNQGNRTHAELLRGEGALGTLFAEQGFPGVPSLQDPCPEQADDYFNGGYNTLEHGSNPGGTIDAIQMELYSAIRFNTMQRSAFAKAFATIVRSYLEKHYFEEFTRYTCQSTSVPAQIADRVELYPNPANDYFFINGEHDLSTAYSIRVVDLVGREVLISESVVLPIQLDISTLQSGMYHVYITNAAYPSIVQQMIVL